MLSSRGKIDLAFSHSQTFSLGSKSASVSSGDRIGNDFLRNSPPHRATKYPRMAFLASTAANQQDLIEFT